MRTVNLRTLTRFTDITLQKLLSLDIFLVIPVFETLYVLCVFSYLRHRWLSVRRQYLPKHSFPVAAQQSKKLGAVQVNTARYTRRLEFILETALHATQCALHERLPAADITDSTIATLT